MDDVTSKLSHPGATSSSHPLVQYKGFAALSSTIIQASNIMLDIISCPAEMKAYESLQAEAASAIRSEADWTDATIFKKLPTFDSAVRESLRHHPILIKGLSKEVIHSDGLTLPDDTHVEKGAWVGVPVLGVHMDERFYPDPHQYDPFRSLRAKQERMNSMGSQANTTDLDAGQPTPTYLGFGYGRHSW